MNKQEAMQRLEAMQKEMDQLKAIIEKPDEPYVFQGRYLREGLGREQWWLNVMGDYVWIKQPSDTSSKFGLCFASEEAIKQHREHLRLMQEARIAMAKSWNGEEVDWCDTTQTKHTFYIHNGELSSYVSRIVYEKIHFRTQEDLIEFREKFTDEEIKLMIMGS